MKCVVVLQGNYDEFDYITSDLAVLHDEDGFVELFLDLWVCDARTKGLSQVRGRLLSPFACRAEYLCCKRKVLLALLRECYKKESFYQSWLSIGKLLYYIGELVIETDVEFEQ